jgi:hypothetical protein
MMALKILIETALGLSSRSFWRGRDPFRDVLQPNVVLFLTGERLVSRRDDAEQALLCFLSQVSPSASTRWRPLPTSWVRCLAWRRNSVAR